MSRNSKIEKQLKYSQNQERRIELNHFETLKSKNNVITTTKYKWYNFLFLFLFQQYQKVSNVFYLIQALCNLIPGATIVSPLTAFVPVFFVLAIAAIREVLEDVSRKMADVFENSQVYKIIRGGKIEDVKSCDILQGDIIILKNEEEVPTDSILLYSSDDSKTVFINTASLDGESNLKVRNACLPFSFNKNEVEYVSQQLAEYYGRTTVPPPSNDMHEFNGKLYSNLQVGVDSVTNLLGDFPINEKANKYEIEDIQSFKMDNVLLRGVRLKNTKFAVCGTIFTSDDTRLMQNELPIKYKTSRLDDRINYLIFIVTMIALVCIIAFTCVGNMVDFSGISFENENDGAEKALSRFVQYLIISSYLLPISLFVTIELLRLFQAILIDSDEKLRRNDVREWMTANKSKQLKNSPFAEENESQLSVRIKNSICVENLAEVDIIFSDKTGTLTKNMMTFHSMIDSTFKMSDVSNQVRNKQIEAGETIDPATLFGLALCNTVIPQKDNEKLIYQAESPDEVAFVETASLYGLKMLERNKDTVEYEYSVDGQKILIEYRLIAVIPFSSFRKKMSIILEEIPEAEHEESQTLNGYKKYYTPESITNPGEIFIITKGADSFVLPQVGVPNDKASSLQEGIDKYSELGLRTLAFGSRCITENILNWLDSWEEIEQLSDESEQYTEHTEQLEENLKFLCVSAIEDELEDELQDTLRSVISSGIKVWMLTGDKTQTAVNIAKAAGLSTKESQFIYLTSEYLQNVASVQVANSEETPSDSDESEKEALNSLLDSAVEQQICSLDPPEVVEYYKMMQKGFSASNRNQSKTSWNWRSLFIKPVVSHINAPITIVLDTTIFKKLIKYNLQYKFFHVALYAESVVCCRLSPEEKALIVNLAHEYEPHLTTLAIGDGMNDEIMIHTAMVGIGIAGREGLHAANNSDISMPQFKFLKRLLFVHGRTSHFRNQQLVDYCLFKNSMISFVNFIYSSASKVTGSILSEQLILMIFNTFLTFFPIAFYSMTEKEATDDYMISMPQGIQKMYRRYCPNIYTIIIDLIYGFVCSEIIYRLCKYMYASGLLLSSGQEVDLFGEQSIVMSCICWVSLVRVYEITKIWNFIVAILLVVSLIIYYLTVIFGNWLPWFGISLQGQLEYLTSAPAYLSEFVVVTVLCIIPGLIYTAVERLYIPYLGDIQLQRAEPACECVDEYNELEIDEKYGMIIKELEK